MENITEERRFYKRIKTIGKGGHGYVDQVTNQKGEQFARKKLTHLREGKAYARFQSEIDVILQLKDLPGVIKILDYYFPQHFSKSEPPFYIMELGEPLATFIRDKPHDQVFKLFLKICKSVEGLHERDITHRDINPTNMLVINGEPVLSDFGLANFPLKQKISDPDEAIGAKWTIAPEMERVSSSAAYKKADVYSLAKTLWILITENVKGFEGQYIPHSSISLDRYIKVNVNEMHSMGEWEYFSIVLLEQLLIDSTSNDPDKRPSISSFIDRLNYWFKSNTEYFERNPFEWEDALKRIFPIGIPIHSEWTDLTDILSVLQILTQYDSLNHCFLPWRGGIDMIKIQPAIEKECLQIEELIFRPGILYFERLGNLSWSYFRLDFSSLKAFSQEHDDLLELLYISEDGHYSDQSISGYSPVERYLMGGIIVTAKTAVINQGAGPLDGYSGIHCKMSAADYRTAWEFLKDGKEMELRELIGNKDSLFY